MMSKRRKYLPFDKGSSIIRNPPWVVLAQKRLLLAWATVCSQDKAGLVARNDPDPKFE